MEGSKTPLQRKTAKSKAKWKAFPYTEETALTYVGVVACARTKIKIQVNPPPIKIRVLN